MSPSSIKIVNVLVFLALLSAAWCVPARIFNLETSDLAIEENGMLNPLSHSEGGSEGNGENLEEDLYSSDEDQEPRDEEEGASMLGKLWTGLSNRLNLFGSTNIKEKLSRFRKNIMNNMASGIKEVHGIRSRYRRDHPLQYALTRDTKGFYKLSNLDDNVIPNLKTFPAPPSAISMEVFEHQKFIFWLITEAYTTEYPGALHVYMLDTTYNFLQRTIVKTLGANKCVPVLKLESFVEIVCPETLGHIATGGSRKGAGSGVYRITWDNNLDVTFSRALKTHSAQDVAIWEVGGNTLLAFSNSYDSVRKSGEILSVMFVLQTTVLDGVVYTNYDNLDEAAFGTKYAYGLEAFRIISRQFLAVANHRDDIGNVEIDSVIYVYDFHLKRLKPFQRIRTSAARDWTAFSFVEGASSEHFIAVANEYKIDKNGKKDYEVDSVIYKFDNGKFVPFQCIRTNGARQWVVHKGPNGEFVLALVSGQAGVFFFQYNGWRFVKTTFKVSTAGVSSVSIAYLQSTLGQSVLSVTNPSGISGRPLIFYLEFEFISPLGKYHDDALAWCNSFSNTVENDGLSSLVRKVQAATKVTDAKNFTVPVVINGALTVTAALSHVVNIIILSQRVRIDFGRETYENLRRQIIEALDRIAAAKALLENIRKLLSHKDLDGVHISNARIICQTGSTLDRCSVNSLIANRVNGVSASFANALRIDQNTEIRRLDLDQVIVSNGAHINVDFISGTGLARTPFGEIVTLTGDHVILGTKTFDKLQANYLHIADTVGGIRISQDNILLTVTEQRIISVLSVETLVATNLNVLTLNGRDLSNFFNTVVLNGANQAFTGPLVVKGNLIAPSIRTLNPLRPIDPVAATKNALLVNTGETQIITGVHFIRDLQALQGITVKGLLNGLRIPSSLYLRNANEVVDRPVIFENVVADMVTVDGMFGNIQLINGELDLLLLNGDQTVSGRKTFEEIHLLGHSTVTGTVGGYRLQDLTANVDEEFVRGINEGRRIQGSVTFSGGVTVRDDLIDGVSISRILNHGITLDSQLIKTLITFEGPVKVNGDLRITDQLNGINIDNYVLKDGTYTFTGVITFTSNVISRGNIAAGFVNGYVLNSLALQALLVNGTQAVTSDITLYSPEFKDLIVSGEITVNGVGFDDLVLLNQDAYITGEKTFTNVKVLSNVVSGTVDVGQFGLVDGVVISDLFFADSLRKTGTSIQNLIGRSLNVVIASSASGTPLANFERSIVYKDRTENVRGSWRFTGPVTIQDLNFDGTFDGVSAAEFNSGWLLKTGGQTLTGLNFFQNLKAGDVTFTGNLIQETDLNQLLRNTAKLDEPTTLERVSFDEVISMSAVSLNGKIQGLKLRDEALLSNSIKQVIRGIKTFWDTIRYSGEFLIDGLVSVRLNRHDEPVSINIGRLCSSISTIGQPIIIPELTVDGDVLFGGNVNVTVGFNGYSVLTLGSVFWLSNTPNHISSNIRFADVEISSNTNLNVQGLINGVDIRALWETIFKRECDLQTVTGEFYLEKLTVDRLITDTITNLDDDLGLNDLLNILYKDGNQEIFGVLTLSKLESRDSVILDGTLNNLRVDTDIVLYNRATIITGRKTFHSLTIKGDLIVQEESTVQGVDVSELVKVSVRPITDGSGKCYIPGVTTFKDLRIEDGSLEVGGTVDGVYLNKSRVLLQSEYQEVFGHITLTGSASLEILDVLVVRDDRFNDLDLSRLRNLTVQNDRPNTISASVTFTSTQTFTNVIISNHILNGYNVTDLGLCLSGNHIVGNMGDQFALVLNAAQDAKDMLAEKATELWYFEETPLTPLHKVIPVTLTSNYLTAHSFDTLIGLDLTDELVYIYRFEKDFPQIYNPIPVTSPSTATGLSQNLLATCGKIGMPEIPGGSYPTSDFRKVVNFYCGVLLS
ncbi:hypothetical protein SK128_014351 [Halocaridina rubra]|uniref:Uncharacterized protein n=1 Tax=Halocaridina rubra TaxID=373956 RepID=A0AAN9A201_HALRR